MAAGRVAVVGGGLAGLSAALELKRRGYVVELFERSRLLGGKATSFQVDGVEVDNGQHVYLACCTEFAAFVRGLEHVPPLDGDPLVLQQRFEALLLARGRRPARLRAVPLPAPLHLAPALLGYRHLDALSRLRIGLALLAARTPPPPAETFADWLDRHHQSAASRQAFWDPFFVPALNAPLDEVSAADALFVISTAFLRDASAARFGFARVPLARIAEAAASQLDSVHLRTPVSRIEIARTAGGPPSLRALVLEDGRRLPYDAVVLAVPPNRLARLLDDPAALGLSDLDRFRSEPIVDVHLWYDERELHAFGFAFAAVLDSPVQWVFAKGPGYLCCSMSAAGNYVGWPEADLVALCHQELAAVLPALARTKPVRGAATRDREATFVPAPGLRRPGPVTACHEMVIAGAWTDTGWPATMESAVRSGLAAARALKAQPMSREERRDA